MELLKKRGQVSTFLVIGAILILSVALFLFLKNNILNEVTPGQVVPEEYADIDLYVKECVSQVTTQGLKIIGRNGGFFIIPDKVKGNPNAYVEISPGGNMIVPSWYYDGDIRKPTEKEIATELAIYVEENIGSCLNNFTSFKNKYSIEQGDRLAYVTFTNKEVRTELDYPLNIKKLDVDSSLVIESFTASVDLSFKKIYKAAEEIFFSSRESYFIEEMTLDLMSINKNIPITGMDVSCRGKRWSKNEIKKELKSSIQNELPQLSVVNTNSIYNPTLNEYANAHYQWDVNLDKEYNDLTVLFRHQDHYNFRLEVSPRKGNTLKSNFGKAGDKSLRFLCINIYHFNYDISYPVAVSIIDSDAFGGQGYEFTFVMPIEIESNAPRKNYIDSFLTYYPNEDDDFCEANSDESTQIRIRAEDKVTGESLENVSIYYRCIVQGCDLGYTTYNGGEYSVIASVPDYCSRFTIEAEKENYMLSKKDIETNTLADNSLVKLELVPTKTFKSTIKIFNYVENMEEFEALPSTLKSDETVLLSIINDDLGFESYTLFDEKDKKYDVVIPLMTTESQVEIMLVNGDNVIVGGYNRNLTFTYEQLLNFDEIGFNLIRDKVSKTQEENFDFFESILEKEKDIPIDLRPELK